MFTTRWKRLLGGMALVVALSACGGGSKTPTADQTTAPVPTTTIPAPSVPELDSPVTAVETIMSGLQLDLQAVGYDPGTFSGQFSASTQQALIAFQTEAGVVVSERGALGPATAAALQSRLGGSSEAVQALQSALTDVGLFDGTINGQYGSSTSGAVKALQGQARISTDGLYGPNTAAALTMLYARKVAEPSVSPPPATSSTAVPQTTAPTTAAPSTAAPSATLLKLGSTGPQVTQLQQRLTQLGYRPGSADGTFGASTASAVLAFEKREGLTRDGQAGPAVLSRLAHPTGAGPRAGGSGPRIEVDIDRQIAFVILPGQSVVTLNVSTGNGETYTVPGGGKDVAYTPVGTFTVLRKISGDEHAPLGTLHSPMYFYKGWAIHGAASVPAYPASHGCVRISNTDADWLFPLIPVGTQVVLYDTTGKSPGANGLPSTAAPGY